jgi:glycosyltransferase involved in cell wall biosynthesis
VKILFVGNGIIRSDNYPNPDVGGSVQTWGLCKELAKRGHKIYVVRRSSSEQNIIDDVHLLNLDLFGVDRLGIPFWSYPYHVGSILTKIYFSQKTLSLIQEIKPNIICIIDRFTGVFPSSLCIPKIFIMHVSEALDLFRSREIYGNKLNSIMFRIKKFAERKILKNTNEVIVLNSFLKKYLPNEVSNKISYIPNGVETELFSNISDENFILYAGRFDWNKNVCSLVNEFSKIHELYPTYGLYLIGSGPIESKIRSLINKKNLQAKVKIIPWMPRNKLIDFMGRCSFFVLPSLYEACPVVVLEAMASSKPVIAKCNMGSSDLVVHNATGYLYNNVEELRGYLKLLLSNKELRNKLGHSARKRVEEKYSFAQITNEYVEMFEKLLREKTIDDIATLHTGNYFATA